MDSLGIEAGHIHHVPLHSLEALKGRVGLRRISSALLTFPRQNAALGADEFNEVSRNPVHYELGCVGLIDGVAIIYTTPEGNVDRSHRFIFPDANSGIRYHREAVNPPPPSDHRDLDIDLVGMTALSTRRVVLTQIAWLLPTIERNAARGFSDSL